MAKTTLFKSIKMYLLTSVREIVATQCMNLVIIITIKFDWKNFVKAVVVFHIDNNAQILSLGNSNQLGN